jgi:DNA-binding IclR family transcriptional regulator
MPPAPDRQFATTLARGLDVLRCFTVNDIALGNGEIAERTGLPKATVSRLTYTLTALGYLRFVPELGKYGRYALGSALISISHPLLANLALRQLARVSMHAMAEEQRACVAVWRRERATMVCIEVATAAGRDSFGSDIGSTVSLTNSLPGAAYVASQAQADADFWPNDTGLETPSIARPMLQEMKRHQRLGFCVDRGRFVPTLLTVAAALRHPHAPEVFVFTCSVRVADRQKAGALGEALLHLVKATEVALAASH